MKKEPQQNSTAVHFIDFIFLTIGKEDRKQDIAYQHWWYNLQTFILPQCRYNVRYKMFVFLFTIMNLWFVSINDHYFDNSCPRVSLSFPIFRFATRQWEKRPQVPTFPCCNVITVLKLRSLDDKCQPVLLVSLYSELRPISFCSCYLVFFIVRTIIFLVLILLFWTKRLGCWFLVVLVGQRFW